MRSTIKWAAIVAIESLFGGTMMCMGIVLGLGGFWQSIAALVVYMAGTAVMTRMISCRQHDSQPPLHQDNWSREQIRALRRTVRNLKAELRKVTGLNRADWKAARAFERGARWAREQSETATHDAGTAGGA